MKAACSPLSAWVPSGDSSFLPRSKNMHVRWELGVLIVSRCVCASADGCWSLFVSMWPCNELAACQLGLAAADLRNPEFRTKRLLRMEFKDRPDRCLL